MRFARASAAYRNALLLYRAAGNREGTASALNNLGLVCEMEGDFNGAIDRYEEALRDLIRRKEKGEKPTVSAPPAEPSNVIDLMAALKKSLGTKGAAPKSPSPKSAPVRSKTPKKRAR